MVCREGNSIRFTRRGPRRGKGPEGEGMDKGCVSAPVALCIPGVTRIPSLDCIIEASILSGGENAQIPPRAGVAFLDYDTIPGSPVIRTRHPGDRFHPLGVHGEKRLKEFFIDQKVPKRLRDSWPLLAAGSRIIWVLGLRIGHPFRIRPGTTRVLRLSFDL
jgi:tRNA(Ile)-lysidine synthase